MFFLKFMARLKVFHIFQHQINIMQHSVFKVLGTKDLPASGALFNLFLRKNVERSYNAMTYYVKGVVKKVGCGGE